MTVDDIFQLVIVLVSVGSLLFAFFKWFSSWADKRHEVHHKQDELLSARLEKTETDLRETRDEMHRDFVRTTDIQLMRGEFRDDFQKLFHMVGALSKDLNQIIGEMRNKGGKKG